MNFQPKSIQRIFLEQSGAVTDSTVLHPSSNLVPVDVNDALKGLGIGRNRKDRQVRISAMARESKQRRKARAVSEAKE